MVDPSTLDPNRPMAPDELLAQLGVEKPRCATCYFFRATGEGDALAAGLPEGTGECYSAPPTLGGTQGQHPITGAVTVKLVAVRPFVQPGDACRHWQRDERSPMDYLLGELERIGDILRDGRGRDGPV